MGGDGLSVGISLYTTDEYMNPGDNGIYIISGWEIVGRIYPYENFEEYMNYDLNEFIHDIDMAQPLDQRIMGMIDAERVPLSEIEVGDTVYIEVVGLAPRPAKVTRIEDDTKYCEAPDFRGEMSEHRLYSTPVYRKRKS